MSAVSCLTSQAAEWKVAIEEIRETESSVLGFGVREGLPVVLKISRRAGDEWNSGEMLRAFCSDGTARVYESAGGAALLERLQPGTQLVDLVRTGKDEEATAILADVMTRMAHHPPPESCPTIADWSRGFDRYLQGVINDAIPRALTEEAREIYLSLAPSQTNTMLLHGDLHHYNVLYDSHRGWLAIDPKGVVGEREYEVGAILRNPVEQQDLFLSRTIIEHRLLQLTKSLDLNYERALRWSFAQAVLSVIWGVEDGFEVTTDHFSLQLAETLRSMLS